MRVDVVIVSDGLGDELYVGSKATISNSTFVIDVETSSILFQLELNEYMQRKKELGRKAYSEQLIRGATSCWVGSRGANRLWVGGGKKKKNSLP